MKKTLLFLILILFGINTYAQCWKSASYCAAIKSDGSLWMWGRNTAGRVGDGTTIDKYSPVKIGTDTWKSISSGESTTIAIRSDNTLWAWGYNAHGAVGDGTNINRLTPVQIGSANNWKSISIISSHCLAIKTDGTLWAWGSNSHGALGDGTNNNKSIPVQIGTDTDWKLVQAGNTHSMAIKNNGTLWTWGDNSVGDLGNGTLINTKIPAQVGSDTDWTAISTNTSSNCFALKTNGTLWAWGRNTNFNLGDGTTIVRKTSPTQIGTDTDWFSLGNKCAIKNNGTLWGWGSNNLGSIGDGTNTIRPNPIQVGTDTDWKSAFYMDLKLKNDGTLWISGDNTFGTLGIGSSIPHSLTLVQISATNCSPPIIANDDSGTTLNGLSNTAIANVLLNDTFNGTPATFSDVSLSFINATHSGITLNTTTGAVNVSAAVPVGTYTLNYQICQIATLNCDTASVTITVNPQTIDAVNDNFSSTPIDYLTGGITPSLLTNDTVNGSTANPADVVLTLTSNGGIAGASINANGGINIPVGTFMNTYTLQYSICLISNPAICDTASVTVTIADPIIITTPEIVFAIRANKTVLQSELQSTGKIIISGGFNKYNNVDATHLMRLNTNLTHDTSFLALGTFPNSPYDFKVLPNDQIIVVGTFTSVNGVTTGKGIAKLNADGTVDTSFNVGGTGIDTYDRILSCGVQSDGKILLGGGFIRSYNGMPTENMIRLNTNGTLDTSFTYPFTYNPNTFSSVDNIVIQPDGKILVAGNNSNSLDALGNAIGQPHLFRLNSDGSLDSTFTTTFLDTTNRNDCRSCFSPIQNIVLQPDGKIIIVGVFVSFHGIRGKNNIVRLNSDGTLDTTFMGSRSNATSDRVIKDAVIEPSGKIIIGGEFTTFKGTTANKLARLNADGTLDNTFSSGNGPTYDTNYPGSVFDLNRQSDGKVIVSGAFSHYNNISATNITRIAPEIPGGQARGNGIQLWNTEKEIENSFQTTGEISIYPNPSNGIFIFDLTQTKEQFALITIYNALGQKVYQKNSIPETVNEINLSNLPSGYYYAQITGGNSNVQKVLIKK